MKYKPLIKKLPDKRGYIGQLQNEKGQILRTTPNFCAEELAISALNKHIRDYNERFKVNISEVPQVKTF
ncbi:hypothetical protein ACLSZ3_04665 [Avibacterium gallinarum]|uniref:hypothetical protein n=1 Tax=Avibacterium gallinarum TaxID=755 RepID=UPI003BF85334